MLILIDPADSRPIYVQIMDEVRRGLMVGTLAPDDPLPSVRQLAADLRVNPNTVAQAYRELERDGVVHVKRGQGTFANEVGGNGRQRRAVAREIAARALREAHRHGVGAEELLRAVEAAARKSNGKDDA
ncbi:MAG TPA: GntR family transcriptional regulator [Gemmatimonadaceae bacterium]